MDRQRRLRALSGRGSTIALVGVAASAWACRPRDDTATGRWAAEAAASAPTIRVTQVFVANHGKLVGAFNGFAWVAGSENTRFEMPNPCNESACFRGTDGLLCARGEVSARSCSGSRIDVCRHESWGVKIGLDLRREGGPWGSGAKRYVAIEHRGAKHLRLAAHWAGDGPREYCIDDYASGELVPAERFRVDCGGDGGVVLSGFEGVDKLALELPATDQAAGFDYCITAIHVGDDVDKMVVPDDANEPSK
jgi:hypothetical protein